MNAPRIAAALIVHPDLARRQGLRNQLRRQGVTRVYEAEDAVGGATLARQERVDVVFTPWSAGTLAGPALFAALRARQRTAEPAIVVLDDGLPQATVVAAVKAGANGRLPLPATRESLARLLADLADDRLPAAPAGAAARSGRARD